MFWITRWKVLLAALCFGLFAQPAAADDLIAGVKAGMLFERLGVVAAPAGWNSALGDNEGVSQTLSVPSEPAISYLMVCIAVHRNLDGARASSEARVRSMSEGPTREVAQDAVGNECVVWGGPGNNAGNMWFHQRNTTINLYWKGPWPSILTLAERIDAAVRDDRQIAPFGTFDPPPDIIDPGIASNLIVRPMMEVLTVANASGTGTHDELRKPNGVGTPPIAYVQLQPQFRGLGDVTKVRLVLVTPEDNSYGIALQEQYSPADHQFHRDKGYFVPIGPERVKWVAGSDAAAQGVDGRLIMSVVVPAEPKTLRLKMIAASEDNVIVSKEFEITIRRAAGS